MKDEKPPAPTRGVATKSAGGDEGETTAPDDDGTDDTPSVTNLADLIPRTDIRYGLCHFFHLNAFRNSSETKFAIAIALSRLLKMTT